MDAKLNHSDLSALLAKQAEISGAKAEIFTKAFFDIILEGLEKDGIVKINGLGTFKVTDVASRSSVDVNTGDKIEIKGHKKLTFLPADALKEKVNQPFAMFEPVEIDENYVDEDAENIPIEAEAQENAETDTKEVVEEACVENNNSPVAETVAEKLPEDTEQEENDKTPDAIIESVKNSYPLTEPVNVTEDSKAKKNKLFYTLLICIAVLLVVFGLFLFSEKPKVAKYKSGVAKISVVQPVKEQIKDSVVNAEPVVKEEEPYKFTMREELASKSVGSIGRGDTLLYVADGSLATHTVAADETLVRIALKYYGDKRLWPYIVQYNKLHDPNGLSKGMELLIPRLLPAK